jgi:hypothetical protein
VQAKTKKNAGDQVTSANYLVIRLKVFYRPFRYYALIRDQENESFIKETVSRVILYNLFSPHSFTIFGTVEKEQHHTKTNQHKSVSGVNRTSYNLSSVSDIY